MYWQQRVIRTCVEQRQLDKVSRELSRQVPSYGELVERRRVGEASGDPMQSPLVVEGLDALVLDAVGENVLDLLDCESELSLLVDLDRVDARCTRQRPAGRRSRRRRKRRLSLLRRERRRAGCVVGCLSRVSSERVAEDRTLALDRVGAGAGSGRDDGVLSLRLAAGRGVRVLR